MGDARPHKPAAQHANLLDLNRRHACGTASTLFSSLLVDEQRTDHVLGLAARKQFGEIFRFHPQRGVEWQDRSFIQAGQNRLYGIEIALAFLMRHGVEANE